MTIELRDDDSDPGKLFSDPAHARQDLQLYNKAVRLGWVKDERWDTNKPIDKIRNKVTKDPGAATIKEQALVRAFEIIEEGSPRAAAAAIAAVVRMEGQVQRDDIVAKMRGEDPAGSPEGVTNTPAMIAAMDASVPLEQAQ